MSDAQSPSGKDDLPGNNAQAAKIALATQAVSLHRLLRILVGLMIGALLYFGKPAFAPILFSVLLTLLLSPVVDVLERRHVPRFIASLSIICVLIALMAVIIDAAWGPAQRWVNNAPEVLQSIEKKVRPVQLIVARIESITTRASTIATGPVNGAGAQASKIATPDINPLIAGRIVLIDIATISILTLFLLAGGNRTLRAIEAALKDDGHRCMQIIDAVRTELSRYYLMLTAINIGLGIAVSIAMAWWGLPSPWLWGIMAGVLNFIPYVGPSVVLVVLTTVSLVTFEGFATPIGVAGTFLLFTTLEGQLIQPLLVGFRLNLNPIILFVAIWFGGWFWGVAGVFLITPTLVIVKEIVSLQQDDSLLKAVLISHHHSPLNRYRMRKFRLENNERKHK